MCFYLVVGCDCETGTETGEEGRGEERRGNGIRCGGLELVGRVINASLLYLPLSFADGFIHFPTSEVEIRLGSMHWRYGKNLRGNGTIYLFI